MHCADASMPQHAPSPRQLASASTCLQNENPCVARKKSFTRSRTLCSAWVAGAPHFFGFHGLHISGCDNRPRSTDLFSTAPVWLCVSRKLSTIGLPTLALTQAIPLGTCNATSCALVLTLPQRKQMLCTHVMEDMRPRKCDKTLHWSIVRASRKTVVTSSMATTARASQFPHPGTNAGSASNRQNPTKQRRAKFYT